MTILVPALVGIVSALLTIMLTPTLQHYFWTRQRYAERQFALIDSLNRWAAEIEYFFMTTKLSSEWEDTLFKTLITLSGNVRVLFSPRAADRCQRLHTVVMERLSTTELEPEYRLQLKQQFHEAHQGAIKANRVTTSFTSVGNEADRVGLP